MPEVPTPGVAEVIGPVKPTQPEAIKPGIEPEQQAPGQAVPLAQEKPLLPPNPESAWKAFGKGVVDMAATTAVAAMTPMQNGEHPPLKQVSLFRETKEQNLTIPDAAREAFRLKTAEQMFGLRAVKTEQPMQRQLGAPNKVAILERRAEPARQGRLQQARSQIAPLAKAA